MSSLVQIIFGSNLHSNLNLHNPLTLYCLQVLQMLGLEPRFLNFLFGGGKSLFAQITD